MAKVVCPDCGCNEAVLLLTYHCPNRKCKFWSPICPDCEVKFIIDEDEEEYICPQCGYSCN